MKIQFIIDSVSVMLLSIVVTAQAENPYEIVRALSKEMKVKLPILDSLYPPMIDFKAGEWKYLSKRGRKELKESVRNIKGIKLITDSLTDFTLIPARPIMEAFVVPDSINLKFIEKNQPFYMISHPIFFRNGTRAWVFMALIRGFASTYLFERKEGEWVLIKTIYGWG